MNEMQKNEESVGMLGVTESISYLRMNAKNMLKIILILGLTLSISLTGNVVLLMTEKEPVYFGLNQEMALLPMYPLSEPMVNDSALKAWLAEAVTDIFNMDFIDWKKSISNARKYFTPQAFQGYAKSLDNEGHIATLRQYRSIMHGIPTAAPIIVASGTLRGIRTWEMEIPFMLNYETSEKTLSSQKFIIRARVQRVSTAEYPRGIAISQLTISRTAPGQQR